MQRLMLVLTLMVGMHIRDYRNDAYRVEDVDRLCIEHVRFPFSNFVHAVGVSVTR